MFAESHGIEAESIGPFDLIEHGSVEFGAGRAKIRGPHIVSEVESHEARLNAF